MNYAGGFDTSGPESGGGSPAGGVAVSVVSHRHDGFLPGLIDQIASTGEGIVQQVLLVHNVAPVARLDAGGQRWPFRLDERVNLAPLGFGANHNRSFERCEAPFFCVLNPDVRLADPQVWKQLVARASEPGVGCAFPVLKNPDGSRQDNARSVPTPAALLRRRLLHRPDTRVDWASAAFWMLRSAVFRELGGFDERYHMYCEDVDFCLRLQLAGWSLAATPGAIAVHDAGRRSHVDPWHLSWHLRSLLRLWSGAPMRDFLRSRRMP